jgi:hypothetical protein
MTVRRISPGNLTWSTRSLPACPAHLRKPLVPPKDL